MKIKYWMTKNPVTTDPETSITDAARVMKENHFRHLPVLENGRLVGLVTYRNIVEAQPSSVSTLSKNEARYLVAKVKVRDVMRKNPHTVGPEDDAITAMLTAHQKGIGSYPVMDKDCLVGIVTARDLFQLVVHILGAIDRDDFIYLVEDSQKIDDPNYLSRLVGLLSQRGISLLSFLSFPSRQSAEISAMLLKIAPGQRSKALDALSANGYKMMN